VENLSVKSRSFVDRRAVIDTPPRRQQTTPSYRKSADTSPTGGQRVFPSDPAKKELCNFPAQKQLGFACAP
jgi:hypothetical protein